jgi:putative sigma-54 modulation protein
MTVKAEIFGKNLEITERINDYISKKVVKLDRYINDIDEIRVDLTHIKTSRNSSDRNVAQFTLRGRGYILRAEERADDLFSAIDAAMDKLHRQIERFKGKRQRGRGDGTPASEVTPIPADPLEMEEAPAIVRRKKFTLIPMDEQEAIEQMKLLGHENFFIFYNIESNAINILYQRRDGTYGLIEPQIG